MINWVMPNVYGNLYPMMNYNNLNIMRCYPYNNFMYSRGNGNFYRKMDNTINKIPIKMRTVDIEEVLD